MYMRKELEGARYSNSALLDNNSNLQVEIDSLNNHIRVITIQNEELTRELDQFVEANEAIRMRLDRKQRVQEIRQRNDQQLSYSYSHVEKSKSPIRKVNVVERERGGSPLRQYQGGDRVTYVERVVSQGTDQNVEQIQAKERK